MPSQTSKPNNHDIKNPYPINPTGQVIPPFTFVYSSHNNPHYLKSVWK